MQQDMTQGNLTKAIITFSVPLILSGILQQLYGWADAFIVGNVLGESALAAIGVTATVSNFLVLLITGFVSGTSILSAQYFGNQNTKIQPKILSTFGIVLCSCFFVLVALTIGFSQNFLEFLDTPSDILSMATQYLNIILLGLPFLCVYNVYSAILRGIGDSKAPFYAVLVSSLLNIALDILLVAVLGFGVQGAALATIFSQICMTIYIISYTLRKHPFLRLTRHTQLFDFTILKQGLRLSIPIAIQSVLTAGGNLFLQSFLNSFGTQTVAAITAAYRVDSIILLPIVNLGTAVSTVTAQNTGAGNHKRAKKGLAISLALAFFVSIALSVLVFLFGEWLIALFGISEGAIAFGGDFFRAIAAFYFVFALASALRGYLEGIGDVVFAGICAILSLAVRVIGSYALVGAFGNMTIAYAEIIAWIFMLLLYIARYFIVAKREARPTFGQTP